MTGKVQKILIALSVLAVIGFFMVGLFAGAAVFGWRTVQRAGNEAATVQNLKTIAAVELQHFNNNKRFASLPELVSEQFLSSKFSGSPVTADGYVFVLSLTSNSAAYSIVVDPLSPSSGTNHFYLDSALGRIHFRADRPAGPNDPFWAE